ncbi:transposase [Streptomyces sp. V3I8]|nr:transposase [Streptomyces sp. V3I8]
MDVLGLVVAVVVLSAHTHDNAAGAILLHQVAENAGGAVRKVLVDKGYDYAQLRRWLRERGITHRIARKGVESSQRLGRHRWTVERTMAWLAGCRRLHRRYERKANHFLGFTSIARTLICYHRLTK